MKAGNTVCLHLQQFKNNLRIDDMNKICFMAIAFCAVGGGIFFSVRNHVKTEKANELLFENVEALADGETGGVCLWSGSIVCPQTQVKVAYIDSYSLFNR